MEIHRRCNWLREIENSFIFFQCQNLQIQQTPNPEAQDPALAPPETKVMRCVIIFFPPIMV
jgi:hypothetical protein